MGVEDQTIGTQLGAGERVGAGAAIDDQIKGHGLVAVGGLHRPRGHDAKHGPEGVAHGAGGGQVCMAQEDADPIGLGRTRVCGHRLELLLQLWGGVMGGPKARRPGHNPEVAEQWPVVHRIEQGIACGPQLRRHQWGQHKSIPRAPGHPYGLAAKAAREFTAAAEGIEHSAGPGAS